MVAPASGFLLDASITDDEILVCAKASVVSNSVYANSNSFLIVNRINEAALGASQDAYRKEKVKMN